MKIFRKSLSIILALVMVFSCASVMSYALVDGHRIQIYVEGFESKQIYHKDDTERTDPLFFPLNTNKMISNLMQYEKYLKEAVATGNPDLLYTYVCLWMQDCFGLIALQNDGYTSHEDVVVDETTLNYKGDGKYVFRYDCRLDPVDIAKELKDYIDWVLSVNPGETEYELTASSFGASVAVAFLNEYPEEKQRIDSLVLCVPATNGVNFAGELFSGNFDVDPDALLAFLDNMELNSELTLFLSVLNKTGTLDAMLDSFLEPVLKAALMDALRSVIHDIFGTMPSMWSFVDDRFFYDALENIYGKDYADPDHEYAGLISRITYYHEEVMMKAEDILNSAVADDVKVNIISKYGDPPIPVSQEGNFTGDGFVALEKASFGAVCAMNGEQLPADYVQAKDIDGRNMISPDRTLDASTCLLPNNTWFIKGLWHGEKTDSYYDLINTILYEDIDVTDARYPQFLESVDGYLVPMTEGEEPQKETTWLQDFLTLLPRLFKMLVEKIKGMLVK